MKYIIRDREAGNIIDEFQTMEEAERQLEAYEEEDKINGEYEPDFYEIWTPDTWYAVQETSEDDWGTGSYYFQEAVAIANRMGLNIICEVDITTINPVAIKEYVRGEDF